MSAAGKAGEPLVFALGAPVVIAGTIVGVSEFAEGRPTFWVEFERLGRTERLWFHAVDIEDDADAVDAQSDEFLEAAE